MSAWEYSPACWAAWANSGLTPVDARSPAPSAQRNSHLLDIRAPFACGGHSIPGIGRIFDIRTYRPDTMATHSGELDALTASCRCMAIGAARLCRRLRMQPAVGATIRARPRRNHDAHANASR